MRVYVPDLGTNARIVSHAGRYYRLLVKHPERGYEVVTRHSDVCSPLRESDVEEFLRLWRDDPKALGYKHGAKLRAAVLLRDAGRPVPRRFAAMIAELEKLV